MVDLHDFVDGGCVGLRWIGDDGIVVWANRADYELLGYAQDEFVGQPMRDFFAEPAQADALLARLVAGESIRSYQVQLRCRDGGLRSVSISGRARFDQQGRFLHGMCCTVDDVKGPPELLEARADRRALALLGSVSRAIVERGFDLDDVFERIAHEVTEVLGDCCAIHLLSPDQRTLSLRGFYHRDPAARAHAATSTEAPRLDSGVGSRVVGEGRPLRLTHVDLQTLSELYETDCARDFFSQFMAHSLLAVPVTLHGKALGMLAVWRESNAPYDDADEQLLCALVDRIALAIMLAEQHAELTSERQRLRAVLEQMPSAVAIFEAGSGRPVLMNEQNARIVRSSDPLGVIARRPDDGADALPVERALRRGETVQGAELRIERGDGSEGTIRVNAAPVVDEHGQRVAAVMTYDDITEQIAMVDAVRRSNEQLSRIAEASDRFGQSLDYERTVQSLVALTVPALGDFGIFDLCEGEAVRRISHAHENPSVQALLEQTSWIEGAPGVLGADESHARVIAPIDQAWLGRVARTPEDRALLAQLDIRSLLSVPLTYQGQEIGSITLFYGQSGRVHTERDLALADELARRAAAALVNARLFKEAQEAIGVRDDFLSMAGHELRTPLTALQLQILSISKMLHQPDALEKIAVRAEKAGKNVLRLSNLVNELLDISRISAGRLRLERSTVQLADAVRAVITRHDEELSKSGCAISLEAKQNPTGSWDRTRIEQIVSSLVVNATKYGKGKPIEVTVEQGDGVARLIVRDHGIGVSPEDQERIFQRFERAVSSRHFGGLGLGLWIARQLVDAHGGTIRLNSEQDRGATFEVELPLVPLDEVQA